jgi:hypothetical protein
MDQLEGSVTVGDGQAQRGEGEQHATRLAGAHEHPQAGRDDEQRPHALM